MRFGSRLGMCLVWSAGAVFIAHCGVSQASSLLEPPPVDAAVVQDATTPEASPVDDVATVEEKSNPVFMWPDAGPTEDDIADADSSAPAPTQDCGMGGGPRGKTLRTTMAGTQTRSYVLYLPPSLDPKTPAPLIYAFHGASENGADLYDITQYATLADTAGLIVVFPDGQGASSAKGTGVIDPWNVSDAGTPVCGGGNNSNNSTGDVDFELMDAIKAEVTKDQCIDGAHIFATGFSMGGYFSHHIGCMRPDIRSVAPHSGGTVADLSGCVNAQIPIIIFHGTADRSIYDGCDDPNGYTPQGFTPSATLWAQKNGCQPTSSVIRENLLVPDGGTGQCYLYDGCPDGGQVELCTFNDMGHCWAGGSSAGLYPQGACPDYQSAVHLEWAFWRRYAW